MKTSELIRVFILVFLLAFNFKFSTAHPPAEPESRSSDAAAILYEMIMEDVFELKYDNKQMAEKFGMIQETIKSLETTAMEQAKKNEILAETITSLAPVEAKIMRQEQDIETLEKALKLQETSAAGHSGKIKMLEGKVGSLETLATRQAETIVTLEETIESLETSTEERIKRQEKKIEMLETKLESLEPVDKEKKTCPSNYLYNATLKLCWRLERKAKRNWQNAQEQCKAEGGNLINLNNMAEFQVIQSYLRSVGTNRVFVGASDLVKEGVFQWGNGNPVEQAMWRVGDPDGGTGQNCGAIFSAYDYKLIDANCPTEYEYLCQISID